MKPTSAQLRQLRRDNLCWPVAPAAVPREQWPANPFTDGAPRIGLWRSRTHLVQLFDEDDGLLRMSVNRTDWDERARRFRENIGWDDLQLLKAQIGFAERSAVELYPPDAEVVNVANMRHLWLLPEPPAFMWRRAA